MEGDSRVRASPTVRFKRGAFKAQQRHVLTNQFFCSVVVMREDILAHQCIIVFQQFLCIEHKAVLLTVRRDIPILTAFREIDVGIVTAQHICHRCEALRVFEVAVRVGSLAEQRT